MIAAAFLLATTLAVQPSELRPAPGAEAVVRVASAARPDLAVSAGSLVDLHQEGPGSWVARYVPPIELLPQVALFSAVADGEAAFGALRLFGVGDAEVRTRARGRVSVTIGAERFGPVVADARGVAEVPVVVPPGIGFAMNGARPIDLHVPPTPTLQLAPSVAERPADASSTVELRVLVVDPAGAPRTAARVVVRAGAGEVSPVRELGAGLYAATWTVPREHEGEDRAEAFLEEQPALRAKIRLRRPAGIAATIALASSRSRVVAGEGELTVEANLRDAAGNPAADELRAFASTGGAVVEAQGPGFARVRVPVPAVLHGAHTLELKCSGARGPATATLSLPLLPSEPSQARVALGRDGVRADGHDGVEVLVQVEDRFGNPVPETAVSAAAQGGSLSAPSALGDGRFGATFVPVLSRQPGSALVQVHAGAALADLRIPLLPSQALLALSPKLGGLTNLGRILSPLFSLEAALRFERLGTQFAAVAETSWFFASSSDSAMAAAQSLPAHTRKDFVSLSAGLSFRPFVAPRTQAFVSVLPSLQYQRGTQQLAGQPTLGQSAVTPGVLLSVGAELRLPRVIPLAELRLSWHRDPGLFTVQNPVRGIALLVGSRFEIL